MNLDWHLGVPELLDVVGSFGLMALTLNLLCYVVDFVWSVTMRCAAAASLTHH